MDLKEYLFRKNLKVTVFAREIGYNNQYLYKILKRHIPMGKKLALAIEKGTKGFLKADELLNEYKAEIKAE